ncbi:MAG TPA: carbohydrate kinase family protein [Acidimicrobiia bacterium]|nr:carbohydrate kinase family protein [Acidimicrobiia bacterium]
MPRIVSMGDVDVDMLVLVDPYPRPGEESFADEATIGLGGSAANTAVVLAGLGFDVGVMAQIGRDEFGARAARLLEEAGVDTDLIVATDADVTGMNLVLVDAAGERTMIGLRGANPGHEGSPGWERSCEWLHLSAYALLEEPQRHAARQALALARARSIPVSIDVPSGVASALGGELLHDLEGSSLVAVGAGALSSLVPRSAAEGLLDLGIETVAVTDGGKPFSLHRRDRVLTLTPPRLEVVDATGAGDSFVAGLIAGQLWGADIGTAAVLAGCLGAAATQRKGAGTSLAEDEIVAGLLADEPWPDAEPQWFQRARRLMVR